MGSVAETLSMIRVTRNLSQERLAQVLGVSFVSVNRWERGVSQPSPAQSEKIQRLAAATNAGHLDLLAEKGRFASRGVRRFRPLPLLDQQPAVTMTPEPLPPILERLVEGQVFGSGALLNEVLRQHRHEAETIYVTPTEGISAGKNTYTYDAHTYHTKVPPQGIAELLNHYLPRGGLVLDPFAGSGMTGVAAVSTNHDCILNELSPAACFIASRFTAKIDPLQFASAIDNLIRETNDIRRMLYTTRCRECGRDTELLYTVWSYKVLCSTCNQEFILWDVCRKYGNRSKEHKILTKVRCPDCKRLLNKSRLQRTISVPVLVGYKCCGSRQQEVTHPPDELDLQKVLAFEFAAPVAEGYVPDKLLPNGVNLRQPIRHGLDLIERFYTPRNLAALSHLWRAIHRIEDTALAAQAAFVATSLYQRVTRLSEFRFWGGSGNTARFNVPFISNEANVFVTFLRKARSIQDHLEATARYYTSRAVVVQNSATTLAYLPDESVDLVFTDPPFGSYINYSEMNILWEAWLQRFTDNREEAIINRVQGKGIQQYSALIQRSLKEAFRVLRKGHWMLLVFMNNSGEVWRCLRRAIEQAGFLLVKADIFDKEHGTFKQFVSENTTGCDLVLHCLKPDNEGVDSASPTTQTDISAFLEEMKARSLKLEFLHVDRECEVDFRRLYSIWVARCVTERRPVMDFQGFRQIAVNWLASENG